MDVYLLVYLTRQHLLRIAVDQQYYYPNKLAILEN
jgi:hypothetical protein